MAGERVTAERALAGVEKAAVLLVSLGPEAASAVLRHLGEGEVRRVTQALARARAIRPEQLDQVRRELREGLAGHAGMPLDGRVFARAVVTKALADPAAPASGSRAEILADIEGLAATDPADLARALDGVPTASVAALLAGEHPQIAAIILAHLQPPQAAAILAELPEEARGEVVERLARLDASVPGRLVAEVGTIFREQVKELTRPPGTAPGGPKVVAEIVKHADPTLEARLFEDLERRDAELAGTIRGLLFTFEDLLQLDNRGMQALLKEVAREDLVLGLKTASPALAERIFANLSSRAAEILREDLESAPPARLSEVEAAQARVVATVRELEADGRVVLAGGAKGEPLV